MKHSNRNNSFELNRAEKEQLASEIPVKDYVWDDSLAYEMDDPKHPEFHSNWADAYDIYGDN